MNMVNLTLGAAAAGGSTSRLAATTNESARHTSDARRAFRASGLMASSPLSVGFGPHTTVERGVFQHPQTWRSRGECDNRVTWITTGSTSTRRTLYFSNTR